MLLPFLADLAALVGYAGMSDMPRSVVRLFVGQRDADDCLAAGRYRRTIFRNRRDTPFPGARGGQIAATRAVEVAVTGINQHGITWPGGTSRRFQRSINCPDTRKGLMLGS